VKKTKGTATHAAISIVISVVDDSIE